ncbi:hypothetical protein QYG89_17170, partial [Bacillus sp. B190/17]
YGNGCDLFAIATRLYKVERIVLSKLDNMFQVTGNRVPFGAAFRLSSCGALLLGSNNLQSMKSKNELL